MPRVTRGWCSAVLAAVLVGPAVLALTQLRLHDCTDHVCHCVRRSDSSRGEPARPCHGSSGDAGSRCEMRGKCAHGSPLLMTGRLYLPPPTLPETVSPIAQILPGARVPRPRAGVLRIDSPPPRHS